MDIVEELRTNPESGARRLEAEYKAGLMTLARRFCVDSGDAEELVNRTFAAVVDGIDGYLEQSAFFGWMCQIMSNLHGMDNRRKARASEVFPGDVPDVVDEGAQEAIYANLDASLVREALKGLPRDQRETLILHYFFDMPVAQIAKFVSIPVGTVRSRLHYARKALAAKMGVRAKKAGGRAVLLALALFGLAALGAVGWRLATGGPRSAAAAAQDMGGPRSVAAAVAGTEAGAPVGGIRQSSADTLKLSTSQPSTNQGETMKNTALLSAATAAAMSLAAPAAQSAETIAYWPFGNSGFNDASGNGGPALTSTTVSDDGAAYVTLDGASQFLQTATALDLSGEEKITIECWTRLTGTNKDFGILFSSASPHAAAGGVVCYYNKSASKLQAQYRVVLSDPNTPWQIDATNSIAVDGMWHHVAYTIDRTRNGNSATLLYIDGVKASESTGKTGTMPALFNDIFYIGGGAGYVSGNEYWTGCIDDVRISRGILTPDQFLRYPTVGRAMNAESDALPVVAYWPFGGKGGTDATGNGFDLTMASVAMTSGTPSPSYNDFVNTCKTTTAIPFSAFSKVGLTIECFAKTASTSTDTGYLFESTTDYSANLGAFCVRMNSGYELASAYFRSATGKLAGAKTATSTMGSLRDGRWRHFAFVYDPSKTGADIARLYIDGVAAPTDFTESTQKPFALADAVLHLMRRSTGSTRSGYGPFYGSFDDARITAGALTPDQFLAARSDLPNTAMALYRFDHETLEDQSGNGNDLVHCQDEAVAGSPVFGDGGSAASGTGLVLSGNGGTKDWAKTASPLGLSGTKAVTIEIDYNSQTPGSGANFFLAGSENPAAANGNVVYLDNARKIHGQTRKADGSDWRKLPAVVAVGTPVNGYQRVRYVANGNNTGTSYYTLNVDGTASPANDTLAISGFGSQAFCLGHSPNYVQAYWMQGKILRVAVSAAALAAADYVLDNLVLDTQKATLAYWDFADKPATDKSGTGGPALTESGTSRRNGALTLDGAASAATASALSLSGLTQATIECFVLFGEEPSSGTLFSMGSGAGSFAVAADAAARTLSGSFAPYTNSLGNAVSCGGVSELASLAGKKNWHHVALVIDRTRPGADAVRFYVDYERATPAGRAWDATATMLDDILAVGTGFTGRIDDLRVSAGALEPSEFLQQDARTETPDAFTLVIR